MEKTFSGQQNPYKGSFNLMKPDGSIEKVDSGDSNSLYTSLAKTIMPGRVGEHDTLAERAQCLRYLARSEVCLLNSTITNQIKLKHQIFLH